MKEKEEPRLTAICFLVFCVLFSLLSAVLTVLRHVDAQLLIYWWNRYVSLFAYIAEPPLALIYNLFLRLCDLLDLLWRGFQYAMDTMWIR